MIMKPAVVDPTSWKSPQDQLSQLQDNLVDAEVVLAMARVGWAFCQVHLFEQTFSSFLLGSDQIPIGKKAKYAHLDAGAALLLRHEKLGKTMLGQMTRHLKDAGISTRDAGYLEKLVEIRNDFIHRFSHQVPLPGDWAKYGYTAEAFAAYPQYVGKHFERGSHNLFRMFVESGFIGGPIKWD